MRTLFTILVLILAMAILGGIAIAAAPVCTTTGSFTITPPTNAIDNKGNITSLSADNLSITKYNVYCGTTSGGESTTAINNGTALTYTPVLGSGATAYCQATAVDNQGVESPRSGEACTTNPFFTPVAPGFM
jgi:hypothetical protein